MPTNPYHGLCFLIFLPFNMRKQIIGKPERTISATHSPISFQIMHIFSWKGWLWRRGWFTKVLIWVQQRFSTLLLSNISRWVGEEKGGITDRKQSVDNQISIIIFIPFKKYHYVFIEVGQTWDIKQQVCLQGGSGRYH